VRLDERLGAYFDFQTPRLGAWQVTMGAYAFQDGVEDYSGRLEFLLNWYPTDKLTFRFDVLPYVMGDWLLWETGNLFGSYEAERLDVDLRVDWIPDPRHELRIKWQWIGVDADVNRSREGQGLLVFQFEPRVIQTKSVAVAIRMRGI